MFFIVLAVIILSAFLTTLKFPALTARIFSPIKSRLPKFKFDKFVTNPKLKAALRDRVFFRQNVHQILDGPLFIVIGPEIYKLYDILSTPDSFGHKRNFAASQEAFDILEWKESKFLFMHPNLFNKEKDEKISSRALLLMNRICKYRSQKYIDGFLILPGAATLQFSSAPPSGSQVEVMNFCIHAVKFFADTFKVQIPIHLLAHDFTAKEHKTFKNIFKHDAFGQNNDLYLGFSCNFSMKPEVEEIYDYFKSSLVNFNNSFDHKTSQIMQNAGSFFSGIDAVNAIYSVKTDIFYLSQNFITFFLNRMDRSDTARLGRLTILNSILFSSYEGSRPSENIMACFSYLAQHGTNQTIVSPRLLSHRRNINIVLGGFTAVFLLSGIIGSWKASQFLLAKRASYIQRSIANYQEFATLFNERLSNKFPFASSTQTPTDADINDLEEVLTRFQTLVKGDQTYFYDHLVELTKRSDVKKFIDEVTTLSRFLNIQKDKNGYLSYTVPVRFNFRVRSNEERQARRIVNWTVSIGNDSYGSLYGDLQNKTAFLWTYGDPLTFKLNLLEKNDPDFEKSLVPQLRVNRNPNEFVQGNAFIVQYVNENWSLFKFIEDYTTCLPPEKPCLKSLLQFNIPLANQSNVVFFCEIVLIGTDGYPEVFPVFPTSAPLFSEG